LLQVEIFYNLQFQRLRDYEKKQEIYDEFW